MCLKRDANKMSVEIKKNDYPFDEYKGGSICAVLR